MKRFMKIAIVVVIAFVLIVFGSLGFFFGLNQNTLISWKLTMDLKSEIEENSSMEVMDSARICGKLCGNGNGMEFYGAVLVKADSEEDIENFVSEIADDYDIVGYYVQAHKEIDGSLVGGSFFIQYENFPNDGETYYTVYYLATHKFSTDFDIRAH